MMIMVIVVMVVDVDSGDIDIERSAQSRAGWYQARLW